MATSQEVGYITFPSHTEAMALYAALKEAGIRCTLAPTPRACSVCCGVSVRLEHPEDIPAAREIIERTGTAVDQIAVLPRA